MEHAIILSVEYTTLHVQIKRGILDLIIAHVADWRLLTENL